MKRTEFRTYLYSGLTALSVIALSIVIYFIFNRFAVITAVIDKITKILIPIFYGIAMAFLFAPVYNKLEKFFYDKLGYVIKNVKMKGSIAKALATVICILILLASIAALISMLIPQLLQSVQDMINTYPANSARFYRMLDKLLTDNPDIELTVLSLYSQWASNINNFINNTLVPKILPNLNDYIVQFSGYIYTAIKELFNFLVGIMVMAYLLNIKDKLIAQLKKMLYAFLPTNMVNSLIEEGRYIKTAFSQFIVGKIIDSIIIGILNYIAMLILGMPYALLISVIVGVTNVIPFFGPFLGAIPSAFILLLVSPIQCLKFSVWILILQQLDGNVIGPKVLGQTTGLPSFWILFSILLFGGLFGVIGMIIAVPTWAVIYRWLAKYTDIFLLNKELSTNTSDYVDLASIDLENKTYNK